MRHFRVTYKPRQKWMTSREFTQWVEHYNLSDIEAMSADIRQGEWEACFSSDSSRACRTAELVYREKIVRLPELREIGIQSMFSTQLRLHVGIWLALSRMAWYFSHKSHPESRGDTHNRVSQVIDSLEGSGASRILVVSHGGFMRSLSKELLRRGYRGSSFLKPANGKLYIYEK
jgi:broad specificity phosphatase PhoE